MGELVRRLHLTDKDTVIVDRTTGIGQAIFENVKDAKLGIVIHADHFSEGSTDENNILWNNYYEYSFRMCDKVDFYITATMAQKVLVEKQFEKYLGKKPKVVNIPVGSLDELKYPTKPRRKHALITASRLAGEKHCDWLALAAIEAKKSVLDLSLDIYGKGTEEGKIRNIIRDNHAEDYIRLMGQQDLSEVYLDYEAYVSASQSEGFGLTLLEAVGSGLPMIGFDVRYGNQTFIDPGENGYRIQISDTMDTKEKIKLLAEAMTDLFTKADWDEYSTHSYEIARDYLTKEVKEKWEKLIK